MAITYYYPEGPLGPTCDIFVDDVDDDARRRRRAEDLGDGRDITYGPVDWGDLERVMDGPVSAIRSRRCRVRTLADGTQEYYDCVDDLLSPIGEPSNYPLTEPQMDWKRISTTPWGLEDNFEPIKLTPIDCSPFDPDINITPVKFFKADGTFVEKTLVERSSPPTFPVSDGSVSTLVDQTISASFVEEGGVVKLRITGTGNTDGQVSLRLRWKDNPSSYGTALGNIVVNGRTFTQSGRKGKQMATMSLAPGTDYPLTITGGTGYGGYTVRGNNICFYDLDGDDCNAEFIIDGTNPAESEPGPGAWNDDADAYAVWVNPEVCTLPCQQQEVTYFIDIPETDTYTITGGADDSFKVFLNDSTTPIIDAGAGIFSEEHERRHTGNYTPPHSVTQTLQQGILKMVVQCTNSAAGFGSCDGAGSTYSTVPLYRYVNSTTGDHFTGTDATAPSGYANEGVLCHLFTYPFPGSFQVVDYEPGKPQSSYTLYGFSPFKVPPFDIGDEPVSTTLIYAKSNGNDVMWTDDATEGNGDTPAYALDTTNSPLGYAFYGVSSPTTIVLGEGLAPFGNAYKWAMNPGGWYIKICRGTSCISSTTIPWVRSGPDAGGDWGSFMNQYAVYPSNSNVLLNTIHSATYNVLIPFAGNYSMEWGMDDDGTISLDGTEIINSGYEPNSQTYALNNLSAGPHTIGVTIRNNGPSGDWIRNPGGIAWAITPTSGSGASSIDWTISGASSDSGYRIRNNGQRIQWDDDATNSFDVNATMDIGQVTQLMGSNVSVSFSADGTGLDVTGFGEADVRLDFSWDDKPSISGQAVGSLSIGGQTFTQSGTKGSTSKTIKVTAGDVVASSLDLEPQTTGGNLIWHTRKATGYKFVEIT